MTAPMILYTFEDAQGYEWGSYSTSTWADANEYAMTYRLRVIENTFEWSDSELVADYTDTDDPEDANGS